MRRFLLPDEGKYYKANLHSHSTVSDGLNTPEEMKEYYKAQGYDILAITDHELLVDHSDLSDSDFLMISGYEYCIMEHNLVPDAESYSRLKTVEFNLFPKDPHNENHIMFNPKNVVHGEIFRAATAKHIGPYTERDYSVDYVNRFIKEANENRFLVFLNHPSQSFESWDFFKQLKGLCAMEIHNQGCFYDYQEYNSQMYDALSRSGMHLAVIAADDNHRAKIYHDETDLRPWGFTMIKAKELTYPAVISAIEKGDMYATQGPLIEALYVEDGKVYIRCSDVKAVVLKTDLRLNETQKAKPGKFLQEAVFDIPAQVKRIRITVVDGFGRYADTRFYDITE